MGNEYLQSWRACGSSTENIWKIILVIPFAYSRNRFTRSLTRTPDNPINFFYSF